MEHSAAPVSGRRAAGSGDKWVRAAAVASSAAGVFVAVLLVLTLLARPFLESNQNLLLVPLIYGLLGAAWARPWTTAGMVWLGTQSAVLGSGLVLGTMAGWGPFVWYATSFGFIAAFSSYVGAWLRQAVEPVVRAGRGPSSKA